MSALTDKSSTQKRLREIETLRHRCRCLSAADQALMQMVFEQGSSFQQIARLIGRNPSTVNRRFNRLIGILIDRQIMAVLRTRYPDDPAAWRVVHEYYLRGRSQKAIARTHNISVYRVRTLLKAVRSIVAARDRQARQPSAGSGAFMIPSSHRTHRKGD